MYMGFKKYFSNGTDRKADNYPMVKRNRRWVLASALMLAMFGAGWCNPMLSLRRRRLTRPTPKLRPRPQSTLRHHGRA